MKRDDDRAEHPAVRHAVRIVGALLCVVTASGCVTVRPEQRAVLSDPKMRFQGDPRTARQLDHALANREGSYGGGSVQGGGCGCN